jgi:signal transduction histidine kinase
MCLKNKAKPVSSDLAVGRPEPFNTHKGHSLRVRLMFCYGGLLLLGLICSGLLVLLLASNAINVNIKSAIQSESRLVGENLARQLFNQSPYWPEQPLTFTMLDHSYGTTGITIEVFNLQGKRLYASDPANSLSPGGSLSALQQGQRYPIWYNVSNDGNQNLVGAWPVFPPTAPSNQTTATQQYPLIGVLLVAKSLNDTNATLGELQGYLFLTGVIILVLFLGCGWAVMGYALSPLTMIAGTARSIANALAHGKQMDDLSQRVSQPVGQDEMAQVVDAFNEMLASLESSTISQRRFIADASHELRAPLTTIQGNLAFLIRYMEDIPPAERHVMLADAHGETLRLASLVDELLLLARADASMDQANSSDLPLPVIELDRTLLKLVRQMRRRMEIEAVPVKLGIGLIEPVRVRGDEESMRRIMVILLDNAIKYTRPERGQSGGTITVSLERLDNEAVLKVTDTGIGIEARDLPHIFERFYRADQARSREGTGLGLAIAQTLVEQLHGHIFAESTPGEGSTFSVCLPLVV